MLCKDLNTTIPIRQVITIRIKVTIIFVFILYLGFIHKMGRAKGPTQRKAITKKDGLKYHGIESLFFETGLFRDSPQ